MQYRATKVDPPRGSAAGSYSFKTNRHGLRHASCGSLGTFPGRDECVAVRARAPQSRSGTEAWVDQVPAWHRAGRAEITASNCHDDQDFDQGKVAIFVYERALALLAARPAVVDSRGGTSILINGVGFYPSIPSVLSCRFRLYIKWRRSFCQ